MAKQTTTKTKTEDLTFHERVIAIQSELKAPKSQYNSFGKYSYRNQEDILEAVKPLLYKHGLSLTITDEIHKGDGLMIVQAEAVITDGENHVSTTAQAGIDPNRKGMDIAQSFGSSSSYARKYALNGLFLIDDTKDSDSTNTHDKEEKSWLNLNTPQYNKALQFVKDGGDINKVLDKYKMKAEVKQSLTI
jgi:hypothetical protein